MNTKVKYEHRIIAFIDVLGFAEILSNTIEKNANGDIIANEDKVSNLNRVFERIRDLMGVDEAIDGSVESRQVTQFSDSIVISFDLNDEPEEFKYLLGELLYLHIELLRYNMLIRGGISHGLLIHTDKVLFGPAMVKSYQLESLAATSPRIILPKSLYEQDDQSVGFKNNKLDDIVSVDEDDFYYLDYYDKCQNPDLRIFTNDEEYIEHMKKLREVITEGLRTDKPGIYSKYGWMKTKWNRCIKRHKSKRKFEELRTANRILLYDYFKNEKLIKTAM